MKKNSKIYIAGHNGLVGSAILKNLKEKGYSNFILKELEELDLTNQAATEVFFKEEKPEYVFLAAAKVGGIVANNTYRAEFIYLNLMIQNNVIHNSWKYGVKKLLFLGSTCIYPKEAVQPIKETELLTNTLEYTNEPYAIAKIAGVKMCESYNLQYGTNFLSVMPTNLYGPNDNFDLEKSHVLPALIRKILLGKFLEENNWEAIKKDLNKRPIEGIDGTNTSEEIIGILAKYGVKREERNERTRERKNERTKERQNEETNRSVGHSLHRSVDPSVNRSINPSSNRSIVSVEIWGSGKPLREFLWSEEMADACVFVMENINFTDVIPSAAEESHANSSKEIRNTHINIGSGEEISIAALAELIKQQIGFKGQLIFNSEKPDGTMRKVTDIKKLNKLGWKHKINLPEGINLLIDWYTNR